MKKLKDKKITIYAPVILRDAEGFSITKWKPIHPGQIWAYVRQLSQKEYYTGSTDVSREERLFSVNWRNDLAPEMAVLYKGKWWFIVRVDPYEDYKNDIQLYVQAAVGANVPAEGDVLPWEG